METEEKVEAILTSENGFYVGDFCHQMTDEDCDADWSNADYEGVHELRGCKFAVGYTACGDGYYYDQQGNGYGVDSGTIAILPLPLCKEKERMDILGKFVDAKKAWFKSKDGLFNFRFDTGEEIIIDTNN